MYSRSGTSWSLILFSAISGYVRAAGLGSVSATDKVCRLRGGRAALFNDKIFLTGANVTLLEAASPSTDSLLTIDLSKSRDLTGYLTDVGSIALPDTYLKSTGARQVGGAMWFDRSNMYDLLVAQDSNKVSVNQFWQFGSSGDSWEQLSIPEGSNPAGDGVGAAYTSVQRFNTSFFSGGTMGNSETGIIELDSSDPAKQVLSRRSEPDGQAIGSKRSNAPLFYLPYGNEGVFVMFGGVSSATNDNFIALSTIDVYDIESGKWYTTPTYGDTPSTRKNFCGWVTRAPDNSSSFVTIYGGEDYNRMADHVWVLTVPSFNWIRMNDTTGQSGRRGHNCFNYKGNNGILVGGEVVDDIKKGVADCSPSKPALAALDLSQYIWKDELDPTDESPFTVHPDIAALLRNQDSNLDLGDSNLNGIFSRTVPDEKPPTPPTPPQESQSEQPSNPTETGSPQGPEGSRSPAAPGPDTQPNQHRSLSTSQKAAIGGAVGGLFIVLVTLGLACFFIRKRKDGRPDRYIYHSKSSSLTICDNEQEKDGFLAVPTGDYGGGYRDAVPAPMLKSGHTRIESWSRQVPAHRNSSSVSSISKLDVPGHRNSYSVSSVSKLDNTEDFYRNANKVPGGLAVTTRGPISDISSVMGTIIVCDGESPGMNSQRPQISDAAPLTRQSGTLRGISPFRQSVRDTSPYRPEDVGKTFI